MYTNGEKLDGEWNGSAYPDYGIYTYANGDKYGGSWKQGKKHGIGTYYFVSGAKYQGEYKDGEPHGTATFIEKNGNAYEEVSGPPRRRGGRQGRPRRSLGSSGSGHAWAAFWAACNLCECFIGGLEGLG